MGSNSGKPKVGMATETQKQELIRLIRPNMQDTLDVDSSESAIEKNIKLFTIV